MSLSVISSVQGDRLMIFAGGERYTVLNRDPRFTKVIEIAKTIHNNINAEAEMLAVLNSERAADETDRNLRSGFAEDAVEPSSAAFVAGFLEDAPPTPSPSNPTEDEFDVFEDEEDEDCYDSDDEEEYEDDEDDYEEDYYYEEDEEEEVSSKEGNIIRDSGGNPRGGFLEDRKAEEE